MERHQPVDPKETQPTQTQSTEAQGSTRRDVLGCLPGAFFATMTVASAGRMGWNLAEGFALRRKLANKTISERKFERQAQPLKEENMALSPAFVVSLFATLYNLWGVGEEVPDNNSTPLVK